MPRVDLYGRPETLQMLWVIHLDAWDALEMGELDPAYFVDHAYTGWNRRFLGPLAHSSVYLRNACLSLDLR